MFNWYGRHMNWEFFCKPPYGYERRQILESRAQMKQTQLLHVQWQCYILFFKRIVFETEFFNLKKLILKLNNSIALSLKITQIGWIYYFIDWSHVRISDVDKKSQNWKYLAFKVNHRSNFWQFYINLALGSFTIYIDQFSKFFYPSLLVLI